MSHCTTTLLVLCQALALPSKKKGGKCYGVLPCNIKTRKGRAMHGPFNNAMVGQVWLFYISRFGRYSSAFGSKCLCSIQKAVSVVLNPARTC